MRLSDLTRLAGAFATGGGKMTSHNVFVYGTLKKGEPNHNWLTRPENGYSRFVSQAETDKKYPLVIASRCKHVCEFGWVKDCQATNMNVMGEVYEVDDKMLASLDILEDHPTFYIREMEKVNLVSGGAPGSESLDCWIYFLKKFKPELLSQECIRDYRSCGAHGKPYAEREQRDPSHHAMSDVLIR